MEQNSDAEDEMIKQLKQTAKGQAASPSSSSSCFSSGTEFVKAYYMHL